MQESLARLSALLCDAEAPWWIIGSAAVALHGGDPGEIQDIDVLLGHMDAERYFRRLNLRNAAPSDDPLFRSDLFARWLEPALPVELMAGLKVKARRGWSPLSIRTRVKVENGVYVPSREELRSILRCFGRDKDIRRAGTLG